MRAYKQLTTKDVVITPFDAMKGFGFSLNETTGSNTQIEFFQGTDVPYIDNPNLKTGISSSLQATGVYHSVKQMYYSNYISSSLNASQSNNVDLIQLPVLIPGVQDPNINSDRYVGRLDNPRYENYLQSSITQSRYIETKENVTYPSVSVLSIPSKLYGENIVPQTFEFRYTGSGGFPGPNPSGRWDVKDDGEGNLWWYPNGFSNTKKLYVGNIFYSHGIATFTSGGLQTIAKDVNSYLTGTAQNGMNNNQIFYSSSYRIYEHSYECTAGESEFTYTQNPTSLLNKTVLSTEKDALLSSLSYFPTGGNFGPGTYTDIQFFLASPPGIPSDVTYPQLVADVILGGQVGAPTLESITVKHASFVSTPQYSDDAWTGWVPGLRLTCLITGFPQIEFTLNPEAFQNFSFDQATYRNDMTGSYFSPYLTTVGLYDDNKQLLAVGKLSNPTPISKFTDTTVMVNFDIS